MTHKEKFIDRSYVIIWSASGEGYKNYLTVSLPSTNSSSNLLRIEFCADSFTRSLMLVHVYVYMLIDLVHVPFLHVPSPYYIT